MRGIKIPFCGFYYSILSDAIDGSIEYETEALADDHPEADYVAINSALYDAVDFTSLNIEIAQKYLDEFIQEIEFDLRLELDCEFDVLTSPRYYNFETDKIFAKISLDSVKALFEISQKDGHKELKRVLEERHKSRDGFISFYSYNLSEWLAKPIDEWDEIELESLLIAVLEIIGSTEDYERKASLTVAERVNEIIHQHTDWQAFKQSLIATIAA